MQTTQTASKNNITFLQASFLIFLMLLVSLMSIFAYLVLLWHTKFLHHKVDRSEDEFGGEIFLICECGQVILLWFKGGHSTAFNFS